MTSALVTRPRRLRDSSSCTVGRTGALSGAPAPSGGDGLTLEQLFQGVWEGLRAGGAAECPVCAEHMRLALGAERAHCAGCASTLS